MNCSMCGSKMKPTTDTNFHYAMSGLSKVYLSGVKNYKCTNTDCGEDEVDIPNIDQLHKLLSEIIAKQENKLLPEEVRFLRTHLGYSGVDFARKVGVDAATVSRWENGKLPMGEVAERLLRLMILAKNAPLSNYDLMDMMAQKEAKVGRRRNLKINKALWVEDRAA